MKKLVLILTVMLGASMVSCGGDANKDNATADTLAPQEDVIDVPVDSDFVQGDTPDNSAADQAVNENPGEE